MEHIDKLGTTWPYLAIMIVGIILVGGAAFG